MSSVEEDMRFSVIGSLIGRTIKSVKDCRLTVDDLKFFEEQVKLREAEFPLMNPTGVMIGGDKLFREAIKRCKLLEQILELED